VRFRSAPVPASVRRAIVHETEGGTAAGGGGHDPGLLGEAIGRLLLMPPTINVRHIATHRVSVAERLAHLRRLLRRGAFSFDEAVRGADRMTVAVTLFALLELYKQGEVECEQDEAFGEIAVHARAQEAPAAALALGAGAVGSIAG
jgi:segregation and condensation protein A